MQSSLAVSTAFVLISASLRVIQSDEACKNLAASFNHVTDRIGVPLCTADNGTLTFPYIPSVEKCMERCDQQLGKQCLAYTYYTDSGMCAVFNTTPRNYKRQQACFSYRVRK